MKILLYIQYFFYIGFNWNWRIAFHILKNEIKGEKKYGINTTGADELKRSGMDISHATIYMPVSYDLLEDAFTHIPLMPRNHFLDIGCGKGRALSVAAFQHYRKITGIDFSETLCYDAEANLSLVKQKYPSVDYSITKEDALYYSIPSDVDCIFMFNPFDAMIMKEVVNNIIKSVSQNRREIYVIYVNPLYKDLFIKKAFTEIHYSKRLKYLEVSILKSSI